ncbi:unnamed protein product [Candidula unifasciata]|uniref:BCL2/adenovirus E1B 19 kDa protein-interacting protein 3 n=1 Tax=Candidula unifasciata TaxID=100452 RepID=A0A8S3YVU9_9EUPU|nr:unnamed protein product [Candidula unifasciata]
MASAIINEKSDDLKNSWVELSCDEHAKEGVEAGNINLTVTCTDSMEKLLFDAQRESATPSRPNSNESSHRGSPKSPASPSTEWPNEEWRSKQDLDTDLVWDWSSRPEVQQSFDKLREKFRHSGSKLSNIPVCSRNAPVTKKTQLFSWANLPNLFLTHACTFFLGAAVVFIYLRKYYGLNGIVQVALD